MRRSPGATGRNCFSPELSMSQTVTARGHCARWTDCSFETPRNRIWGLSSELRGQPQSSLTLTKSSSVCKQHSGIFHYLKCNLGSWAWWAVGEWQLQRWALCELPWEQANKQRTCNWAPCDRLASSRMLGSLGTTAAFRASQGTASVAQYSKSLHICFIDNSTMGIKTNSTGR